MNDCPLELVAGRWTCPQCGWVYPRESARPPRRNCPTAKTAAVGPAVARSDAELAAVISTCHSNTCGAFDAVGDACRLCGCSGRRRGMWHAKLLWGHCPRGKW